MGGWKEKNSVVVRLCCFIIQMVVDPFALLGGRLKFLIPYLAGLGSSPGSQMQDDIFWRRMKGSVEFCNMHQTK